MLKTVMHVLHHQHVLCVASCVACSYMDWNMRWGRCVVEQPISSEHTRHTSRTRDFVYKCEEVTFNSLKSTFWGDWWTCLCKFLPPRLIYVHILILVWAQSNCHCTTIGSQLLCRLWAKSNTVIVRYSLLWVSLCPNLFFHAFLFFSLLSGWGALGISKLTGKPYVSKSQVDLFCLDSSDFGRVGEWQWLWFVFLWHINKSTAKIQVFAQFDIDIGNQF